MRFAVLPAESDVGRAKPGRCSFRSQVTFGVVEKDELPHGSTESILSKVEGLTTGRDCANVDEIEDFDARALDAGGPSDTFAEGDGGSLKSKGGIRMGSPLQSRF